MGKHCVRCDKTKSTCSFGKDKTRKDGLFTYCKVCAQEIKYERNKERILEINAQWKANNIERWREYHRNYEKEYYKEPENHRRRIAIYQRYRDKNRDKIRAYKTSERGREVNNRSWNKRRSIERQLLSTLTEEQWEECKRHFNFNCAYCESDESLTYDHFIPISKKGSYTVGNIIPACLSCNSSKSDSSFFDWYPLREFYCEEKEEKILKYLKIENNKQQMAFF